MSWQINLKALGHAITYSSISFAIANLEIPDKFTLFKSVKTQEDLNVVNEELARYIRIALFLTVGTTLILWTMAGWEGVLYSILANLAVIYWIYSGYRTSFFEVAKKKGLEVPKFRIF